MVPSDYVHRIGRTGRAGVEGDAISLVCVDERPLLRDIERLLGAPIETAGRSPASSPIHLRGRSRSAFAAARVAEADRRATTLPHRMPALHAAAGPSSDEATAGQSPAPASATDLAAVVAGGSHCRESATAASRPLAPGSCPVPMPPVAEVPSVAEATVIRRNGAVESAIP